MAKLSRPSLIDVRHITASGFIYQSSATELFASLTMTAYNQVFSHSVVKLVKYFAHKLCFLIAHVLHRSIVHEADAHSHLFSLLV